MKPKPKKANPSRRTNILRIRLTEEERQVLEEAAQSQSLDTSSWARSELLREARKLEKIGNPSRNEGS